MKNAFHILILSLVLLPMSAHALTFDAPERELTPGEKKIGSMYRGCIGYHCLEEESYLEIAVETGSEPCERGHGMAFSPETGPNVCLTTGTNAREGVVVIASADRPVRACLEDGDGSYRGPGDDGCGEILKDDPVLITDDLVEDAFARLRLDLGDATRVRLMTLIAY